jgi:hypothetical protein
MLLSLGSLSLPPSNKESLGQFTPLHVVTLGPTFSNIFVPWLRWKLPTNPGGIPIPTHPRTTLRMWLARSHPPDCPACIQHWTFFGESTYPSWTLFMVSPFGVSGIYKHSPCLAISGWLRQQRDSLSCWAWIHFVMGLRDPLIKKPGPKWPIALGHLAQHTTRTQWWLILMGLVLLSGICAVRGCSTVHNILLSHYGTRSHSMGASTSSVPSDSPLRCLLNNLDTLGLTPDIKQKTWSAFALKSGPLIL